jgi:hypothetical protein
MPISDPPLQGCVRCGNDVLEQHVPRKSALKHSFLVTIEIDDDRREPIARAKEIASAIIDAIEKGSEQSELPPYDDIEVRYLGGN